MKTYMTVVAALFAAYAACAAKIEVVQDRDTALYGAGEEVAFKVSVRNDSGELMPSGRAVWKLDNFGTNKLASGKVDLAAGNPFVVKGRMAEAGFMRLCVSAYTNAVVWGVGCDVGKIRQDEPCPADFDAYWTAEKARLEREVPLDPKVTLDEKRSTPAYN